MLMLENAERVYYWGCKMFGLPDVAIGAITASVIAGVISLLGLLISKEQKTSEFRQAWIDDLRKEVASLIAYANAIHGFAHGGPKTLAEGWKGVRDDFVGINQAAAMIRLRLNPNEPASMDILRTIEQIERLLSPGRHVDFNELNDVEKTLAGQTAFVLKTEWNRVRAGEIAYRVARHAAVVFVLVALIAGSVGIYKAASKAEQAPPTAQKAVSVR